MKTGCRSEASLSAAFVPMISMNMYRQADGETLLHSKRRSFFFPPSDSLLAALVREEMKSL